MKSLTEHLWFETPHRRGYINITDKIESLVRKSGVQEGLCLVKRHGTPPANMHLAERLDMEMLSKCLVTTPTLARFRLGTFVA